MINVLLCSYNNYYNRIVKKLDTVTAYRAATTPLFIDLENINFNPADGVTTDLIVGKGTGAFLSWETQGPNYCIVYESTTVNDVTTETIKSRWFIMDEDRTRNGQYKISLRRDVLADNIENLETSPIYVEKGIITDVDNPLLCNNEGLTVNQIKKEEILLNDKSTCPWLVLYLKKRVLGTTNPGESGVITIDVPKDDTFVYLTLNTPIAQWQYYNYTTTDYKYIDKSTSYNVYYEGLMSGLDQNSKYKRYQIKDNKSSSISNMINITGYSNLEYKGLADIKPSLDTAYKAVVNNMRSQFASAFNYQTADFISQYNGKVIKDSTGKYFNVTVYRNTSGIDNKSITSSSAPNLKNTMTNAWNSATGQSASPNNNAFTVQANWIGLRIQLEEMTGIETSLNFSNYDGVGTQDSPLFDAICMPYGTIEEFVGWEVSQTFITSADRSMKIMNAIATALTDQYVLDLQLLPYCPIQDVLNQYYDEEGRIAIVDEALDNCMLYCYDQSGATDIILTCPNANITFDINKSVSLDVEDDVPESFKVKYVNDCTLLRVCSPNYNGLFEMNLAKNGMSIEKFNVDMTLRPFNPYIHVNPEFKGLYGEDFNDIRGLVCNGDFSLGIVNDAWAQYEIQNKNYQAIFDRQIQNLDFNNKIARMEAGAQMMAGTAQGAATGATAGFMAGGGYGAAAGAIIGGGLALGGGLADMSNLYSRQQEARSYAIDNFNLQLGNIRALPVSITKTSALTANNKLFPFVEIYECTDIEKEAYYNKLRYDGMTVGKIDTLNNYVGGDNFFKGQLIRNETLHIDNHILNEINNELMKGVYI